MKNSGVLWIGGDKRQIIAENVMYSLGWDTSACLSESQNRIKGIYYPDWQTAFEKRKILIFPLPMTKDGKYLNFSSHANDKLPLAEVFRYVPSGSLILGGKIPDPIGNLLTERGIRFIDYYNEDFQIRNALPTAEGAIAIALRELPITLSGADILVIGYGRIGKILSVKLQHLGALVTIAARKSSDLAMAKAFGQNTIFIQEGLRPDCLSGHFDVIFNTVPVCLFGREQLANIKQNTLLIDLASSPGGVDLDEAKRFGIRTIQALSLPGKFSPITSGNILADTVVQILAKEDIMP